MFREIIKRIKKTMKINQKAVDGGNVKDSSFAAGMVRGYVDVLQSMGHEVIFSLWNDGGCDGISYMEIDGVILICGSKIDHDSYKKLLEK